MFMGVVMISFEELLKKKLEETNMIICYLSLNISKPAISFIA